MNVDVSFGSRPIFTNGQGPGLLAMGYSESQREHLDTFCVENGIRFFSEHIISATNTDDLWAACLNHEIVAIIIGPSVSEAQYTLTQLTVDRSSTTSRPLISLRGEAREVESAILLLRENHKLLSDFRRESAARKKVFSLITHDLRSPFSSIIGVMQLLLADYEHMHDEDRKEFLRALLDSAKTELELLDRLSQWGRSLDERLEPNIRMVPLDAIVETVIRSLDNLTGEKGIEIISEVPVGYEALGDADLIQTALTQLCKNAVHAGPANSNVRIFIYDSDDTGIVSLKVEDHGPGFPENIDPFEVTRGANDSRLGIGLSMAANLARLMGGFVGIDHSGKDGSIVSLRIKKKA